MDSAEEIARLKQELERRNVENESLKEKLLKVNETNVVHHPEILKHTFSMDWDDIFSVETRTNVVKMGDIDVSIGLVKSSGEDKFAMKTYLSVPADIDNPLSVIAKTECALLDFGDLIKKESSVDRILDVRSECIGSVWNVYYGNDDIPSKIDITVSIIAVKVNDIQLNDEVVIGLDEKDITVKSSILMAWSEYFRAYFTSDMKEKAEGRFPVKDVTVADFQEMLSIIYPTNQSINSKNVEKMLELADRFIMPMLTRKCEMFLSAVISCTTFPLSKARIFLRASQYNLGIIIALFLDRWTTASLLRSEFLITNEYDQLPPNIKQFINAKFVEVSRK